MEKEYDVIALGEVLIDFTENGSSEQGNTIYEANPGGAPGNVLSMLARLGHKTAFIGKVGNDIFGKKLKKVLQETGIDVTNLNVDAQVRTTLAFVETKEDGDRDFSFYRNPGADMMLTQDEIQPDAITQSRIFHFGTLSMTDEPARSATKYAVELAKKNGLLVSFDPNIRKPLWKSEEEARCQTEYGLKNCDILKISDNEIQWFTGEMDFDAAIRVLRERYQIPLILLSLGAGGSRAYCNGKMAEEAAYLQGGTIETTGAGDTFGGCCLHYVLEYGMDGLTEQRMHEMLCFANAAASVITTRKGALWVMPEPEEIAGLMKRMDR